MSYIIIRGTRAYNLTNCPRKRLIALEIYFIGRGAFWEVHAGLHSQRITVISSKILQTFLPSLLVGLISGLYYNLYSAAWVLRYGIAW